MFFEVLQRLMRNKDGKILGQILSWDSERIYNLIAIYKK